MAAETSQSSLAGHSLLTQPSRILGCKDKQDSSETDWAAVSASLTAFPGSDTETGEKAWPQVWLPGKWTLKWGCSCMKLPEQRPAGECKRPAVGMKEEKCEAVSAREALSLGSPSERLQIELRAWASPHPLNGQHWVQLSLGQGSPCHRGLALERASSWQPAAITPHSWGKGVSCPEGLRVQSQPWQTVQSTPVLASVMPNTPGSLPGKVNRERAVPVGPLYDLHGQKTVKRN